MVFMEWQDSFSVGVAALDEDHKKLIATINELYDSLRRGQSKEVMDKILKKMTSYCEEHFTNEERLFAQTNYPAAADHIKEHENLARQLLEIEAKYEANTGSIVSIELMNFLRIWLVDHFLGTDKKYTEHFNANGII